MPGSGSGPGALNPLFAGFVRKFTLLDHSLKTTHSRILSRDMSGPTIFVIDLATEVCSEGPFTKATVVHSQA